MILADSRLRPWLEARIGVRLEETATFIGRIDDDGIVAAIGFSHYTGHDIELSVAGVSGGGTRRLLSAVFGYVFDQLSCCRCTVRVRASNARSLKLARRLGFEQEGVLRRGYGDEDAIILGLLRTDYVERWRQRSASP